MLISANYICPVRGLASLEPPETGRLGQAAKAAKGIGLERLLIPVLEEALMGRIRAKIAFLDGLVDALDQVNEAGLEAWIIAPTQRLLGLDWAAPPMVGGFRDPTAQPVFVDGKVRHLGRLAWWADPSLIQKKIGVLRELLGAVSGHPGLTGWLILDRALEWVRPDVQAADWVLKAFWGEIRDQDEDAMIDLGIGWSELLQPEVVAALSRQVDGLHVSGLEVWPPDLRKPARGPDELRAGAYIGALSQWLFSRPTVIEVGWGFENTPGDPEWVAEAGERLGRQALGGVRWVSLADPESGLGNKVPPWALRPGLEGMGLLDAGLEPKAWVEPCISRIRAAASEAKPADFVDVEAKEYTDDPQMHFSRLWEHFLEFE
jgi:hypothetical protein